MKLRENIAVSESGFVFDPDTGESFSVNSTGKMILLWMSQGKTISEIEALLSEEFEIEPKTFLRYMDDFGHSLRRFNLLDKDEFNG